MLSETVLNQFKNKYPDYLMPGGTLFKNDDIALLKYGKGVVLDLGTFLGLSATILSINAKKVYTVDQFKKNKHMDDDRYNYLYVKKDLKKFKNIKVIKGRTKDVIINDIFDVIFIDAAHCQPQISEDYVKWTKQLKSDGYLLFHDCVDIYPDIKTLINKIKKMNYMKYIERIGIIEIFQKY